MSIPVHTPMCKVVTAQEVYEGKQKSGMVAGISAQSVGAKALCMHLITMPPGARGAVHLHDEHETALYVTQGWTRTFFGADLEHSIDTHAGQFLYIPAGVPHVPANLGTETASGVLARTDPNEQESVRLVDALEERAAAVVEAALARADH